MPGTPASDVFTFREMAVSAKGFPSGLSRTFSQPVRLVKNEEGKWPRRSRNCKIHSS
jgi:hypothetical protein